MAALHAVAQECAPPEGDGGARRPAEPRTAMERRPYQDASPYLVKQHECRCLVPTRPLGAVADSSTADNRQNSIKPHVPHQIFIGLIFPLFVLASRWCFDILRAVVTGQVATSIFTNNLQWQ